MGQREYVASKKVTEEVCLYHISQGFPKSNFELMVVTWNSPTYAMGKKQVKPESIRRRHRVESSTRQVEPTNSPSKNLYGRNNHRLFVIILVVFIVSSAISILVYRHFNQSPPSSFVHNRGLVKYDITYEEILAVIFFSFYFHHW